MGEELRQEYLGAGLGARHGAAVLAAAAGAEGAAVLGGDHQGGLEGGKCAPYKKETVFASFQAYCRKSEK